MFNGYKGLLKVTVAAALAVLAILAQGCPFASTMSEPYLYTVSGKVTSIEDNGLTPAGVQVGDAFTAKILIDLKRTPVTAFFIPSFVSVTNDPENNLEVRFLYTEYDSTGFDPMLESWGMASMVGVIGVGTQGELTIGGTPYIYGQASAGALTLATLGAKVEDWAVGTNVKASFDIPSADPEADEPLASIISSDTVITAIDPL